MPIHDNTGIGRRRAGLACATLLSLLATLPALATNIVVNGNGDGPVADDGVCTLREAIIAANTNTATGGCPKGSTNPAIVDTIVIPAGVYTLDLTVVGNEDAGQTGDLDVTQSVRLRGVAPDYTIIEGPAGLSLDRVLDVHATTAEFAAANLSLRHGNAASPAAPNGGNLRIAPNVAVRLIDVNLLSGRAELGGGLYTASDVDLHRVTVADNLAAPLPGGATGAGGGIAAVGQLRMFDSRVLDNEAQDQGGGIYAPPPNSGLVRLYRTRVEDNVAGAQGGGVYTASTFDIQYASIQRNTASRGGGVYMAIAGDITHSALIDNTALLSGGGIEDVFGGFVRYSTLAGNTAPVGGAAFTNSSMTLFDSNTIAANNGGGVFNQQGAFFEFSLLAANVGGNCTGNDPMSGAMNLDDGDTCGFIDDPDNDLPNLPNTDPLLGTLADHGGPTPTFELLPGSPAIDAVSSLLRMNCELVRDQRGRPRGRPRDAGGVFHCDIGAFERGAPFVVDSTADEVDADPNDDLCLTAAGDCTLRAAVQQANAIPGSEDIVLAADTFTLALAGADEDAGATGDLDLTDTVTLRGAGAGLSIVDGAALDRVFDARYDDNVSIPIAQPRRFDFEDLTVRGGSHPVAGGGISSSAPLRLRRVIVEDNAAPDGAGVLCQGDCDVEILDSTVRNNTGTSNGGGLFQSSLFFGLGRAIVERSTFVGNEAGIGGGGESVLLFLRNSTVTANTAGSSGAFFAQSAIIEDSTVVGNRAPFQFSDSGAFFLLDQSVIRNTVLADNLVFGNPDNCSSNPDGVVSLGFNLTDTDAADCALNAATDTVLTAPGLGALADNGGPTLTMAPLAGSPVLDAGDDINCPEFDQRGQPRPQNGDASGAALCDIGAFEAPDPSADADQDGVADSADNCTLAANPTQTDVDSDGFGNACDADFDNDCVVNVVDLGLLRAAFFSSDPLTDLNEDGVVNVIDLGQLKAAFFQPPGPGAAGACTAARD